MTDPKLGPQADKRWDKKKKWHILYSQWATEVDADSIGAAGRTNKDGRKVYEIRCLSFAGQLTEIRILKAKYGWVLLVTLDSGELNEMWIPLYSSKGRNFLNFILNANIARPIKLSLIKQAGADDHEYTNLFISEYKEIENEHGNNWYGVKHKYPKWEGLPGREVQESSGVSSYHYTNQTIALLRLVKDQICSVIQEGPMKIEPKQRHESPEVPPQNTREQFNDASATVNESNQTGPMDEEVDDLPF